MTHKQRFIICTSRYDCLKLASRELALGMKGKAGRIYHDGVLQLPCMSKMLKISTSKDIFFFISSIFLRDSIRLDSKNSNLEISLSSSKVAMISVAVVEINYRASFEMRWLILLPG